MTPKVPPPIADSRRQTCNCECKVDFEDPCAFCPKKLWGPELCSAPWELLEEEIKQQEEYDLPFPKTKTLAENFLKAVGMEITAITTGKDELELDEIKRRYSICENCEFFHKQSKRCIKCGCFMKWKTAWRSQHCPIGKW